MNANHITLVEAHRPRNMKPFSVKVPPDFHSRLNARAAELDLVPASVARCLLIDGLERLEKSA